MNLLEIIKQSKTLYNLNPEDIDDFPGGGGGGGGTGGGGSGTTSGVIIPGLTISPNTNQSIALGSTLCLNASGAISIPQEAESFANLDVGCSATSNGTWIKSCGTNSTYNSEASSSRIIYKRQPFHIVGSNGVFTTPGSPINNYSCILGVKSTGGYKFFWEVIKYCNADPSNCESHWLAYPKVATPYGTLIVLGGGRVEAAQNFKVKGDGNMIIWEYTTRGNWAYGHQYMVMPSDVGNFQFFADGLWLNNRWTNLKTYRGSYQGTIPNEEYSWTSNCIDDLVINGNQACYTPTIPGSCQICVSTPHHESKCINVIASPLYIKPIDIECNGCSETLECENIPNPTLPILTITNPTIDSILISWEDSISFTEGLRYEININDDISTILDSTVLFDNLEEGEYNISVRSIDNCGNSNWTEVETIIISSSISSLDAPENFELIEESINSNGQKEFSATWNSVVLAVNYEIWIGNPQSIHIITTSSTTTYIGYLSDGLEVSVRAINSSGVYSNFSNIEIVS